MFRQNTAGFVDELPDGELSNVDGESNYVRVQVLTNAVLGPGQAARGRDQFTRIVAGRRRPGVAERAWVLLTEAVDGGWGLWGHAHTNEELVAAAAQIAELQAKAGGPTS